MRPSHGGHATEGTISHPTCCAAGFQIGLCRLRVNRFTSTRPGRTHNFRYTPKTGNAFNARRNVAAANSALIRSTRPRSVFSAARQPNGKFRAFADLARYRHVAAHQARELAGNGKAETRAPETLCSRGIGLGELLEQ